MADSKTKVFSQRLTAETIETLEKIKEQLGIETYSQLFDDLCERFYNPIKVNKENVEIIATLKDELKELKEIKEIYEKENLPLIKKCEEISESNSQLELKLEDLENYNKTLVSNFSEVRSQNEKLETEIAQLHEKLKNSVYVDPFNMKVLQKVAERETRNRGKDWNKSQIVNCIIDFRFIKGTLNAGFDSLPDHVINEIRKELE